MFAVNNTNLQATASATIYAGTVDGFSAPPLTGMLPMTYDVNNWKNFLATGQDPDGNTNLDANGNPEIQIYPEYQGTRQFRAAFSLNDSHAGESTVEAGWVDSGMSASDLAALVSNNLIPLSTHNSANWDWVGGHRYGSKVWSARLTATQGRPSSCLCSTPIASHRHTPRAPATAVTIIIRLSRLSP